MSLWSKVIEAFNDVVDLLRGSPSEIADAVESGAVVEPPYSPDDAPITDIDPDPFDDYYRPDPDEIHDRIDEFDRMSDYLSSANEFEPDAGYYIRDWQANPDQLRHVRYSTADEAIAFLIEAGIGHFSQVVYVEEEDLYTIAVGDSPGVVEIA